MDDIKRAMLGDREAQEELTERNELLSCPFCGGKAMIEYDTIEPFEYTIFCCDCGVMPVTSEDEKVCVRIWNTRAPILTMEQIERLEEME